MSVNTYPVTIQTFQMVDPSTNVIYIAINALSFMWGNTTSNGVINTTGYFFNGDPLDGGAGGSPGGSNTDVQYNNSGVFGGDGAFTFDKITNTVAIANTLLIGGTVLNSTAYDGTANDTSFVGSVSAANVVSNAQLQGNLSNYQTTTELSANVATLTANDTSFVGSVSAANVVSNAQLQSNLANYTTTAGLSGYQTTAGLAANVLTLTANNADYLVSGQTTINSQSITIGNSNSNLFGNSTIVGVGNSSSNATVNSTGFWVDGYNIPLGYIGEGWAGNTSYTSGDPGTGNFAYNNSELDQATQLIVSLTDAAGYANPSPPWSAGSYILMTVPTLRGPTGYVWLITAITPNTTYFTANVSILVALGQNLPSADHWGYFQPTAAIGGPGGSNSNIQFNGSNTFTGSNGFTFNSTTNTISIGNSSVNATINSTSFTANVFFTVNTSIVQWGNSTSNATINTTGYFFDGEPLTANGGGTNFMPWILAFT